MLERVAKYVGGVVALLLVSGVALLIGALAANFLQSLSTFLIAQADWVKTNTVQATFTVRSIMNFYYIIYGILFLGFFLLMEYQLITVGIPKKRVLRRTMFILGIESLILAALQLGTLIYAPARPLQIGLTIVEVLLGVGLISFGRRKAVPTSN